MLTRRILGLCETLWLEWQFQGCKKSSKTSVLKADILSDNVALGLRFVSLVHKNNYILSFQHLCWMYVLYYLLRHNDMQALKVVNTSHHGIDLKELQFARPNTFPLFSGNTVTFCIIELSVLCFFSRSLKVFHGFAKGKKTNIYLNNYY